jgi:hypothetical protein
VTKRLVLVAILAALFGAAVGTGAAFLAAPDLLAEGPTGSQGQPGPRGPVGPAGQDGASSDDETESDLDPDAVFQILDDDPDRLKEAAGEEEEPVAHSLCDAMQSSSASVVSDVALEGC